MQNTCIQDLHLLRVTALSMAPKFDAVNRNFLVAAHILFSLCPMVMEAASAMLAGLMMSAFLSHVVGASARRYSSLSMRSSTKGMANGAAGSGSGDNIQ